LETPAQERVVQENGSEECGPSADGAQAAAPDDEAEVGPIAFDKRKTPITAWE
jgi:hypothetical protein